MDELKLPPGQRAVDGFPRFGTHFHNAPPAIPPDPVIEIGGAVREPTAYRVADLETLPRRELTAGLHCVAGWSATDLHWEGVAFKAFYEQIVRPRLRPRASIAHVVFEGLDGYRSFATLEDAMADDVLLAEHLDGRRLAGDHGAPVRLVSPSQYGFISTKHLCRIELHGGEPAQQYHRATLVQLGLQLVKPHPRARVWKEERHRHLPPWLLRPVYRCLIPPIRFASARGSRGRDRNDARAQRDR